jgi:hypothetical protein
MKMETTEVSETSTLSIHTPGNYPKKEITRYSKHGESLKKQTNVAELKISKHLHRAAGKRYFAHPSSVLTKHQYGKMRLSEILVVTLDLGNLCAPNTA